MLRRCVVAWLCVSGSAIPAVGGQPEPATASGVVFHDLDGDGVRSANEPGLPNVRVSNGGDIVLTDADGRYRLPVTDDTIIFVIKPRGWATPIDELKLHRFYYIHKPAGSPRLKYAGVGPTGPLPASVDFPLTPQNEPDRFDILLLGDTQPRNLTEIEYLMHDVIEQLSGTSAAFAVALGDLVYDDLELAEPLNQALAQIGVPIRPVLGNHDQDYAAADDVHADEHFERTYGPPYYSFDYGPVHFVVLDDVIWHGKTEAREGRYEAGLGARQVEFLRNDLALVPADQLIVLLMHIPIIEVAERGELSQLLAKHPNTVSFSAHYHYVRHWFLGEKDGWSGPPHHHMTVATASGSWWSGAPDELGIPHTTMRDGTPNGWTVVSFDGRRYEVRYQPARRPAGHQMNVYAPESVSVEQSPQTEVLVNVFFGSERSTVEMRVGGRPWVRLEPVEREDPYYAAVKKSEESEPPPPGRKLPKSIACPHLWRGVLPAGLWPGTHRIDVRATDMFGRTHSACRLIRVTVTERTSDSQQ